MPGIIETFKDVNAEVLLIGGSESPQFLKNNLDALEKILNDFKRVELQILSHTGPLVSGKPEIVAYELKNFFYEI